MTSEGIYALLLAVGASNSRLEKEKTLDQEKHDPLLRWVMTQAYSPFITFGVSDKTFPIVAYSRIGDNFDDNTATLLRNLSTRYLSGQTAVQAIVNEMARLNYASSRLLKNIILKDLRCGVAESIINNVFPGLIPTFDCAKAIAYKPSLVKWPWAAEYKYDGLRTPAFVHTVDGVVTFYSRNGLVVHTMDHCAEALLHAVRFLGIGDCVVDGEAVVPASFNQSVSAVKRKEAGEVKANYVIFDIVPSYHWYARETATYRKRREMLEKMVPLLPREYVSVAPMVYIHSAEQVEDYYQRALGLGYEGLILKNPEDPYSFKKNKSWLKMKPTDTLDLEIVGVFEGEGKYEGMLGGVYVTHKGVKVGVGSGFSDGDRETLWANPPIGRLAEIMFQEVTPDGSLRHPRFKKFRHDKE